MSDTRPRIQELHRQGHTALDIAHQLGVAQSTVHYHLRKLVDEATRHDPVPASPRPPGAARSRVETRNQVTQLLAAGFIRADVARRLGLSKSTVSYHARRLGATIDERCARRYDWKVVQAFHDDGNGIRACIREFGFTSQTWYGAVRRGVITPRPPFLSAEQFFAAGIPRNRGHLKQRLLREGLKDGRCERCGIDRWLGQSLSLALHHVNGLRDDNRVENLQLLCPNCHSQTDSFAGRNGRSPIDRVPAVDAG